jgi:cation diffusion facilitator CzcD-associated flavoprotein CzcO
MEESGAMPGSDVATGAVREGFTGWLAEFGAALADRDVDRVRGLFLGDSHWKDMLSFGWSYRTDAGGPGIAERLVEAWHDAGASGVRVAAGRTEPRRVRRFGRRLIEGFFDFDTVAGRGTGLVRLVLPDEQQAPPRAWMLLTTLQELHGYEERAHDRRPSGLEHARDFAGPNWLDKRRQDERYADRDPEVMVVGAGHAGLTLAARLRQLGVDTLVVEKHPRVGDGWRQRYHALTLHNEVAHNHLPYLPFPTTWPTYLPKDKLAGWLEAYSEFMELNVWTATEFVGAEYDRVARTWTARVGCADGSSRQLRVPHIVLATGSVSGEPHVPELPGLSTFDGEVLHSSQFRDAAAYAGRRAVVVGTGNSGHDIAQDLYAGGAEAVTLVQRGPTAVISLIPSGQVFYGLYSEGPPVDDMDLVAAATAYPELVRAYQFVTARMCELDRDLLDRLRAVGFRTDFGEDDTGFYMKYLRTGGGYYIDVGCADLIADRKIGLTQAADIDTFTPDAVRLVDGTTIGCDVVVLATGYRNQQDTIRKWFGDEVADRVGRVWGFDEHHFMRNMWTRTAQDGLWVTGGSLLDSRFYSRFLALQLKADLAGLTMSRSA